MSPLSLRSQGEVTMDRSDDLVRQRSRVPAIRNWPRFSRRLAETSCHGYEYRQLDHTAARSTGRWRELWRRIVKERRKTLHPAAGTRLSYDPYTYARNFDQGAECVEPENLSPSFSARFAGPSRPCRPNDDLKKAGSI